MELMEFYRGKKVLITGHTGFKGAWLTRLLTLAGANVTGYSLAPETPENLFDMLVQEPSRKNYFGDIRNIKNLSQVFSTEEPDIVIHMAAQPIVRESYRQPVYTYETNVMGTVNVLECIRLCPSVKSFVNVTTDKVYENKEWEYGYRETDRLDGYDPYSNSKSCSELVTHSYVNSFFQDGRCAVSTCRAGNVIGGGDFAADRIIPDCVRAAKQGNNIVIRNPHATRPFQHVLEPLAVYLIVAMRQYEDGRFAGCYNVGPDDGDCIDAGHLADLFCRKWGRDLAWENRSDAGPHEANFLKLDCSKVKKTFGWSPRYHVEEAVEKTADWYKAWLDGADMRDYTDMQIREFFGFLE